MEMALLFVLSALLILPAASGADQQKADQGILLAQAGIQAEQPASEAGSSGKWFSDGKALGPWWTVGALEHDPMPPEILYHIQASYNFSKITGNLEMKTHGIDAAVTLRKNRFTNEFSYNVNDSETSQGGATITTKDKSWGNILSIDLTPHLYIGGGAQWEHSDSRQIENEYVYLGGLGGYVDIEKAKLKWLAAYGRMEEESMLDLGNVTWSNKLYVQESIEWPITETVSFNQSFDIFQDLDESDIYDWTLNLSMNFQVFAPLSVNTSYEMKYDNHPASGVEDKDTTLTAGVTLTF